MKRMLVIGVSVLAVVLWAVPSASAHPSHPGHPSPRTIAAYSIAAPTGQTPSGLVARAIVPAGFPCPTLRTVDTRGRHHSKKMKVRANPANTGAAFATLTACSLPIPAHVKRAFVDKQEIPAAMPDRVKRMAIFGDTGCRVKGSAVQNCSSPEEWPLGRISEHIATDKPDLIVFTGDFFYRESACPADKLDYCGSSPSPVPGMPFLDTSDGWAADVFTPMAKALPAAPLVITRGNHEACQRGGNGYFVYFDPREGTSGDCAPFLVGSEWKVPKDRLTDPYAVDVKVDKSRTLRLVTVDASSGWDCEESPLQPAYRTKFEQAAALTSDKKENWLLIHRPVFGWQPNTDCSPEGGWTVADEAVASQGFLGGYSMLLSSHIHLAQAVNIPGQPGQLVIGNGGTMLETVPTVTFPATGPTYPSATFPAPTSAWADVRFGYVMASPGRSDSWKLTMKDVNGSAFAGCTVASQRVECANR